MYSVCVTFLLWLCSCCRHCCFSESKKRFSFVQEIKGENFVQRVKDLRSQNEKFQMVLLMKKDWGLRCWILRTCFKWFSLEWFIVMLPWWTWSSVAQGRRKIQQWHDMATMWKDHWPQCRLQQFVTLASWILFLVLLHTSYLHSTSPSSNSMRSETSVFELQEKGHSQKIITAAARHILSTEHQANISLEVETGEVLPPATAATGLKQNVLTRIVTSKPCENVRDHTGFASACAYVQANTDCHSGTLVEYTVIFYCRFAKMQLVGYLLFFIWLGMLFYMLGNTAADYFCCSLEKLTNLLRLPPTVSGVSLLPLGNGAPDVFASIAAFLRSGHSQVI